MKGRVNRFLGWSLALAIAPALSVVMTAQGASAGGSCHSSASAGTGTQVTLREVCFGPTVIYVQPGATVTWTNRDPVEHTVTGLGFLWGSQGNLGKGDSTSYQFRQAGIYPYECILHPGMVGAVVVGEAGSPSKVQGLAAPLAVQPSPPPAAAPKQPAPVHSSSGLWRVVSMVTLALLLAAVAMLAMQWRRRAAALG